MRDDYMPKSRIQKAKHVKEITSGAFYVTTGAIIVDTKQLIWIDPDAPVFYQKDDIACIAVSKENKRIIINIEETNHKWVVCPESDMRDDLLSVCEVIY